MILAGVAYTAFSESLNVEVRHAWAYSDLMPILPWIGTGLSPLAQWVVVPSVALWWTRRVAAPQPGKRAGRELMLYERVMYWLCWAIVIALGAYVCIGTGPGPRGISATSL